MTSRWCVGRHQLGFGANVAYWKSSQTSHARSGGSFMFNGQTTGRGLADLLVGALGSVEHGVPNLLVMDMDYVGLYAQDAWRMSDRVTLNSGRPLGTVPRPADALRRGHELQPRQLREQREEHRCFSTRRPG